MLDRRGNNESVLAPGDVADVDRQLWQEAQDRILRYLKALHVSPQESLAIAKIVMEQAYRQEADVESGEPVRQAMRLLHRFLKDCWHNSRRTSRYCPDDETPSTSSAATNTPVDGFPVNLPAVFRAQLAPYRDVRVTPPLKRSAMPPGRLKR